MTITLLPAGMISPDPERALHSVLPSRTFPESVTASTGATTIPSRPTSESRERVVGGFLSGVRRLYAQTVIEAAAIAATTPMMRPAGELGTSMPRRRRTPRMIRTVAGTAKKTRAG